MSAIARHESVIIREAAKKLRDAAERDLDMTPPVNVKAFASACGIDLTVSPMEEHMDGIVTRGKDRSAMVLPAITDPCEERVRIAHMIGHMLLHMKIGETLRDSVRHLWQYSYANYEADVFATGLLIPNDDLDDRLAQIRTDAGYPRSDVADIAEHFGVPVRFLVSHCIRLRIFSEHA